MCVENAGKSTSLSGSNNFALPGLKPKMAASIIRTCVGLKSTICYTKLSGTVSHSISKTLSDTFPCKSLTILTPTKSSIRIGLPTPATTTRLAHESQVRSSFSTLRSRLTNKIRHRKTNRQESVERRFWLYEWRCLSRTPLFRLFAVWIWHFLQLNDVGDILICS